MVTSAFGAPCLRLKERWLLSLLAGGSLHPWVLQDLAEMPGESSDDRRTIFCVGVGEQLGTSANDPDPALLEGLRRKQASVLPASACEMKGTLVRKGTSEDAVLLGGGRAEWKEDTFVRVVGWRFVSPVNAGE